MSDTSQPVMSPAFREKYELVRELGRGAMGSVWLAEQLQLRRQVAIKFVRGAGQMITRMKREGKILSELSHPSLVGLYDSGLDEEVAFIVLEYVDGETLEERLKRDGPITEERALSMAGKILQALQYIHDEGILHRDLKPGNVLLPRQGGAKLSDFGLARWSEKEATFQTQEGIIPGSPAYMSPEMYLTGKASPESDLWAFSVTLLRTLTGKSPFAAQDIQQLMGAVLNKDPFEDEQFDAAFSPAVRGLLQRALDKKPENRFANAEAYLEALRQVREPSAAHAILKPRSARQSSARPRKLTSTTASFPVQQELSPFTVKSVLAALTLALVLSTMMAAAWLKFNQPRPGRDPVDALRHGRGRILQAAAAGNSATVRSSELDTIVRATTVTFRFFTEAPRRFVLRYGQTPLKLGSMSTEPETTGSHLLRMQGLRAGSKYFYELALASQAGSPWATGDATTLAEMPYWEKPAYGSRQSELVSLGKNDRGFEQYRNEADGSVMIAVPGKEFDMGSPYAREGNGEFPVHRVRVDTFLMDRTPITRRQFRRFLEETGHTTFNVREIPYDDWDDRPMGFLTWPNVAEYCRWAGKRLPTEAEFELACGGGEGWRYPCGNVTPLPYQNVDWSGKAGGGKDVNLPVGSFPRFPAPYGHLDLAAGVRQWCADWFDPGYYAVSPFRNPQGPRASLELKRSQRVAPVDAGYLTDLEIWHRQRHNIFNAAWCNGFRGARDF